ncbi:unnamed protein product, partial [Heterosigma akashiwo]
MDTEDFLEKPNINFICLICQNVLIDPRACNEGHQFCLVCITEWLGRSSTCPARCNSPHLQLREMTNNRAIANLIDGLSVRCQMERCNWVGSVAGRKKHLKDDCPFTEVECKWEGCTEKIQRLQLLEHEASCDAKGGKGGAPSDNKNSCKATESQPVEIMDSSSN